MKGKFKIWCETNEERDAVLKKMEREGIKWASGDKPVRTNLTYNAPVGLFVEKDVELTQSNDKNLFDTKRNDYKEITPAEYIGKNKCIVIYRNDQKVIALDKSTGNKAEATCNPADDFDFEVGAKLAFERLFTPERKCKFKVGDKVIAKKNEEYGITTDGWTGTVVELLDPEKNHYGDDIIVEDENGKRYSVRSEYFDLYEEPEIQVGDTVKVVDSGFCYTTYSDWVAKNVSDPTLIAKYCYDECVENGMEGTVIVIAAHMNNCAKKLVYFETSGGCYLINIDGLKKNVKTFRFYEGR